MEPVGFLFRNLIKNLKKEKIILGLKIFFELKTSSLVFYIHSINNQDYLTLKKSQIRFNILTFY